MPSSFDDLATITSELHSAAYTLSEMTRDVARARRIREHDGDRRKRALAVAVMQVLTTSPECSAAMADYRARASQEYAKAMKELGGDLQAAEKVIAQWEAAKVSWESWRSILSIHKAIANL